MNWTEQFSQIESYFGNSDKKDWKKEIELIENIVNSNVDQAAVYIRAIYTIHNILLEEYYDNNEHEYMVNLLKRYFEISLKKFFDNSEYLFFIGKILNVAEWYFGLDDNELAIKLQKEALIKEPSNMLYEWACRLSCNNDNQAGFLANHLIENDDEKVTWLKNKGFPGKYIYDQLVLSNEKYMEGKVGYIDN